MALYNRRDELPIPPKNAEVKNTVCQYCNVGCGYKVYVWPVGQMGGKKPGENAFGLDLTRPQPPLAGQSYTESMYATVVKKDGKNYHVVIVPARDSAINRGDYSTRGGTNALTTWSEVRGTRERLKYPLLRVGDDFQVVSWDTALKVLSGVIKGVFDQYGPDQLTAKAFDHGGGGGGFENNYGVGSLFFTGLKMTKVAIHNRPAYNSEVWGSRDRGVHELNYSYEDARLADTIVLWGANTYETATVFYVEHMLKNFQGATVGEKQKAFEKGEPADPARMIVIDPRRTSSLTIAETIDKSRVLHLRPNLGTDYVLANAIARVIWEKGWYDARYLKERTDQKTFAEYKQKSLKLQTPYDRVLVDAERITGVPRAQIEKAAEWIAKPKAGGHKRRSLIIYEKGMIWNMKNYDQIAAVVQMAVLGHNIGRPGTGCGRQGGHQEGYVRPPYPGGRPPVNIDKYLEKGEGKFYWVIGNDPYLSTPNNQLFRKRIHERTLKLTQGLGVAEPGDPEGLVKKILEVLKNDDDALFMVVQDLYLTHVARDAHLVLPAAGWGESEITSINCNSRLLRLYDRFMDPPGEAKPDWWIMAQTGLAIAKRYYDEGTPEVAKRFEFGKNWKTPEDVFLAGAKEFPDNRVSEADEATLPAETYAGVDYAFLRKVGQKGIQTPVRRDPKTGKLVGTKRRYTYRFGTKDGKFHWYGTDDWEGYPKEVAKYLKGEKAKQYPFWLTTGRAQLVWQTMYHDKYLPEKTLPLPMPYVEIHPDDAKRLGIASGDLVELSNEEGNGTFMALVTDAVKPGLVFAMMYHQKGTSNSLTSGYTDPKTTIPWYKGTRVAVKRLSPGLPDLLQTASPLQQNKFD